MQPPNDKHLQNIDSSVKEALRLTTDALARYTALNMIKHTEEFARIVHSLNEVRSDIRGTLRCTCGKHPTTSGAE